MNRRVYKTLSWTIVGILAAIGTSYFIFGELFGSLKLVALDTAVFLVLYYLHEYLWDATDIKGDRKMNKVYTFKVKIKQWHTSCGEIVFESAIVVTEILGASGYKEAAHKIYTDLPRWKDKKSVGIEVVDFELVETREK